MQSKNKKVGYTFIKHLYDSGIGITSSEVTFDIPYQDISWHELVDEFAKFVKASGFQPPNGELVWLDEDEEVCTKAERILFNGNKNEL